MHNLNFLADVAEFFSKTLCLLWRRCCKPRNHLEDKNVLPLCQKIYKDIYGFVTVNFVSSKYILAAVSINMHIFIGLPRKFIVFINLGEMFKAILRL